MSQPTSAMSVSTPSRGPRPGAFKKGNPGKALGTVSTEKQEVAKVFREYAEKNSDKILVLTDHANPFVQLQAWKFIFSRAYGAVPKVIKLGLEEDGMLQILAKLQAKRL